MLGHLAKPCDHVDFLTHPVAVDYRRPNRPARSRFYKNSSCQLLIIRKP